MSRRAARTLAVIPVAWLVATAAAAQGPGVLGTPLPEASASAPAPAPRFLEALDERAMGARALAAPRVERAYTRKAERVTTLFETRGITDPAEIFFRVFKRERTLEVWARQRGAVAFERVRTYPVCRISGRLGPKRQEGDLQVPEGFYEIDLLNPWSEYHLSMRVDYPNAVDRGRGAVRELGGDIFIHGGCATIGCVPVTDEWIEELYLIALGAREAGQRRIPVHIFPTHLDDAGMRWLAGAYGADAHYPFWENLREGYLSFERSRVPPIVGSRNGLYTFLDRALFAMGSRSASAHPTGSDPGI